MLFVLHRMLDSAIFSYMDDSKIRFKKNIFVSSGYANGGSFKIFIIRLSKDAQLYNELDGIQLNDPKLGDMFKSKIINHHFLSRDR